MSESHSSDRTDRRDAIGDALTPPAPSPRIALLVPSSVRINIFGRPRAKVGGADMRFDSVHAAIDLAHGCLRVESPCERNFVCGTACKVTGGPPPAESVWYYESSYCPASADQIVNELLERGVSVVVCSSLNVYRHVVHLAEHGGLRTVFDLHNVEYANYLAMRRSIPKGSLFDPVLSDENLARIEVAERAAVEAADELWTCTDEDAELVRMTYRVPDDKPVTVARDVVDVPGAMPRSGVPAHAVFTASLYYYPNALAARELLLDIAPLLDPLPVTVAGAQPGPDLLELELAPNGRIVADPPLISEVTENGVMVVPLRYGGGSRFKIIEAFSSGIPVISTLKGAEGLLAEPGRHYLRAETPPEFAAAVSVVLNRHDVRERIVREAWELARRHYSIEALAAQVATLPAFL